MIDTLNSPNVFTIRRHFSLRLNRYDRIFAEIDSDQPVIVELGVHAGGSLRLWKDVFPAATIIGFDAKAPKEPLPPGCSLVQGSQDNPADLRKLLVHADQFNIVIDDCSHVAEPTRIAFETLFPHVRAGGFYVVEDWGHRLLAKLARWRVA